MATIVNTAMRNAFENIKVKSSAFTNKGKEIAGHVHDAIMSKAGQFKLQDNISLSLKTYKSLVKEGIMPGQDGSYTIYGVKF